MFFGGYTNSIDAKGRLVIPAKLREELGEGFMLTRGFDNCVNIYPKERFEELLKKLSEMKSASEQFRKLSRRLVGSAAPGEYDAQGRIVIPGPLRAFAGLQKEVHIMGVVEHIEIWDKDGYEEYYNSNCTGELFDEATESIDF